jgi:hypothetical protein
MKKHLIHLILKSALVFVFASVWTASAGQTDKKDKQLVEDSKKGIKDFTHTDSLMKNALRMTMDMLCSRTLARCDCRRRFRRGNCL